MNSAKPASDSAMNHSTSTCTRRCIRPNSRQQRAQRRDLGGIAAVERRQGGEGRQGHRKGAAGRRAAGSSGRLGVKPRILGGAAGRDAGASLPPADLEAAVAVAAGLAGHFLTRDAGCTSTGTGARKWRRKSRRPGSVAMPRHSGLRWIVRRTGRLRPGAERAAADKGPGVARDGREQHARGQRCRQQLQQPLHRARNAVRQQVVCGALAGRQRHRARFGCRVLAQHAVQAARRPRRPCPAAARAGGAAGRRVRTARA